MRSCLLVLLLALLTISLFGIEVGGHITQSTTWSPENNPYVITSFLYVDLGVTLTILPGTEVRCVGADKININNFRWNSGGTIQPLSKMIIVNGVINAIGTEEMPITFDRSQDNDNYKWGGVYIYPGARISSFEYCEFRNVFFCDYMPGEWSLSAIEFENGLLNILHCKFEDNYIALGSSNQRMDVTVYDCDFIMSDTYPAPFAIPSAIAIGASGEQVPIKNFKLTIARCFFTGNTGFVYPGYYSDVLFLFNRLESLISREDSLDPDRSQLGSVSSYGNTSINGNKGWGCYSATANDTVFARRNRLIRAMNANPGYSPPCSVPAALVPTIYQITTYTVFPK